MSMIEQALKIALESHMGQVDKGGAPYILHPIRVMTKMATDDERVVAILHDVLEDTDITEEDLGNTFPPHVVGAVVALTRVRGETYKQFIERLSVDGLARRVKLADLKDNMDASRLEKSDMPQEQRDSLFQRYAKALTYLYAVEYGEV